MMLTCGFPQNLKITLLLTSKKKKLASSGSNPTHTDKWTLLAQTLITYVRICAATSGSRDLDMTD